MDPEFLSVLAIFSFIIGHLILYWLSTKISKLKDGTYTEVSSFHLKKGYYWTLLTATCIHADFGHCVYNMIYYSMICFELLVSINFSVTLLLVLYFTTGAIAWIASMFVNRWKYGEMSDYIWSLGASPATYGTAIFFATINPKAKISGGQWTEENYSGSLVMRFLDNFNLTIYEQAIMHEQAVEDKSKEILQLITTRTAFLFVKLIVFINQPWVWISTLICVHGYVIPTNKQHEDFSLFNPKYAFIIIPLIYSLLYQLFETQNLLEFTSLNFLLFTLGKNFLFKFYWYFINQVKKWKKRKKKRIVKEQEENHNNKSVGNNTTTEKTDGGKSTENADTDADAEEEKNDEYSSCGSSSAALGSDDLAHLFGSLAGFLLALIYKLNSWYYEQEKTNLVQILSTNDSFSIILNKISLCHFLTILPEQEDLLWISLYLFLLTYLAAVKIMKS